MTLLIILALLILALPIIVLLGFFHVVTFGFERLGFSAEITFLVLLAMVVGSFVNIPLGRRRAMEIEESSFFGLMRRRRLVAQGLSLNVGGAVIPCILAVFLLLQIPLRETGIAVILMALIANRTSRFVEGKGVVMPLLLPPIASVLLAFVLIPEFAGPAAFVTGVFGVLIGADILRIPKIIQKGGGVMSIGGAGVFDGIFLTAIGASFLATL